MPMKPTPMKERYDSWTVLDPTGTYRAHDLVPVLCDCGTASEVVKNALTQGRSKSCGCVKAERLRGRKRPTVELPRDTEVKPGAQFGRWKALTVPYSEPGLRDRIAQCRCECGTEKAVVARDLLTGHSQSCGCLQRDLIRAFNQSAVAIAKESASCGS